MVREMALQLERNSPPEYFEKMIKFYENIARKYTNQCLEHVEGSSEIQFSVVARIDKNGNVIGTWESSNTKQSKCYKQLLLESSFPIPWNFPFYTVIDMTGKTL